MAVSAISNEFNMGASFTCILNEGAPTPKKRYTDTNLRRMTVDWAAELFKGEIVAIETDTACTHDACAGLPVVRAVANGDTTIIGIIETEPQLQKKIPSAGAADTLAKRLAGEYYRTATVRFLGVNAIGPVTLKTADVAAIVPGVIGTLKVDVSESIGGDNGYVMNDVANGGTGIFSFHAQAKAAGVVTSLLCGFTGMLTGQT